MPMVRTGLPGQSSTYGCEARGPRRSRSRRTVSSVGRGWAAMIVRHPAVEASGRHGAGDEVSLGVLTAQLGECAQRCRVLDSFGDDVESEVATEIHNGFRQRGPPAAAGDGADESAVDLQLVHRQGLEMRKRAVAGAEVVDGDAYAEAADGGQHGAGAGRVGE